MKKRLGIIGLLLAVVGFIFVVAGGVAYMRVQDGYDSLQAFSEVQNVELSYNEDGQLIDRGSTEGADAIMIMLTDEWNYPVVDSDMDPNDPLVNTGSEYMFQMATIIHHVIDDTQIVTLTGDDITAAIASGQLAEDGTYEGVVVAYQGQVLEPGVYEVPVDGRYWTGFNRMDLLDGPARSQAWSGTVHGLVGELSVGTVTHSTLQMGLALSGLLAGLGLVFLGTGGGLFWASRGRKQIPDTVPEAFLTETIEDKDVVKA